MSTKTRGARRPQGDAARRDGNGGRREIKATYQYKDSDHSVLFEVVRYEPKDFRQRRWVDGKCVWSLKGVEPVLYRLPQIDWAVYQGDGPIYIVEGERDVHTLEDQGFIATCSPMGAGKWRDSYAEVLRGAEVVIIADDDPPGHKHAADVARSLIGVAASVSTMSPFEGCKDITDHFAEGFGLEELRILELTVGDADAPIPTMDHLLSRAVEVADEEGRNNGCLWLVCQLRDNRYAEADAWAIVQRFQSSVSGRGEHAFAVTEAREVFDKNFHTEPRDVWMPDTTSRPPTDYGNAERLIERHGEDLRYCHPWKSWLVWDEKRWRRDADDEVMRRAKDTMRDLLASSVSEPDEDKRKRLVAHAMRSESTPKLRAMIESARSEPPVIVRADELDSYPMRLVVENGVIELGTGKEPIPHFREALMTKLAPVSLDPKATAPTWDAFLERVLPDEATRDFVRRVVGYSMTGDVREHALFVLYGTGANGKSVFLETVRAMLGDYAQQAPAEMILSKRAGSIPSDVARLQGARFVSASETEDGTRLAESLVKQLTGGDRITARRLYSDWFEFDPTFKLWLATNHRPVVTGTDDAIWRRIRLVPFEVTIPPKERDHKLTEKLRDELPGILNWALAGCAEWLRDGLGESPHVIDATDEYRAESDTFGAFLDETCETGPRKAVSVSAMYMTYETWANGANLRPMSKVSFGRKMKERGFRTARRGKDNLTVWVGVSVPGVAENGRLRVVKGGKS